MQRWSSFLSSLRIPQLSPQVLPGRGHDFSIQTEGCMIDAVLVPKPRTFWLACRHTPDLRETPIKITVSAASDDGVTIGTELGVLHMAWVNQCVTDLRSGGCVEQAHFLVANHEEKFAVGAQLGRGDGSILKTDRVHELVFEVDDVKNILFITKGSCPVLTQSPVGARCGQEHLSQVF